MSTSPEVFRGIPFPVREIRAGGTGVLAACAAIDALSAGMLLLGTPLASSRGLELAAALHLVAVLMMMSALADVRPSRRWLSITALLAIPLVGVAVAGALLATRGSGSAALARVRRGRRRPASTGAELRHLAGALSPCEALASEDEDQRREALASLGRRGDPEAIVLLRRATAGQDPDLALSAALALDEIGERAERAEPNPDRSELVEVRHGTG